MKTTNKDKQEYKRLLEAWVNGIEGAKHPDLAGFSLHFKTKAAIRKELGFRSYQ
jgi:hypothetical protein